MRSVRAKLLLISSILLLVPSLILGTVSYQSAQSNLNEAGETTIKNAVEMAIQMIDAVNVQVEEGNLTLDEAQEQVKTYLLGERNADGSRSNTNPIDLGEHGYFVVYDQEGNEVAHPSLEGENVWDVQDQNGQYLVQDQITAAQNGGGFTTYSWTFPEDPDRIGEKIMYNDLDPNWGWVVTAGSYMEDFNKGSNGILWMIALTVGIALLAGAVLILLFSRHMSKPIILVRNQLRELSQNNLSLEDVPVNRRDEIGELAESLNTMKKNLSSMIGNIYNVSHTLAASSEELTASAEETNRATEQIAGSIQSISENANDQSSHATQSETIVQSISERIKDMRGYLTNASEATQSSSERVASGKKSIDHTTEKMHEIQTKTQQAASAVHTLGDQSSQIGNIVELITAVSEQTNLLALNAAIEAARAGEHGKGFAVVADEIRKLAEQSRLSAAQIQKLITDIQQGIQTSVTYMNEGEDSVKDGMTAIAQTGNEFNDIEQATEDIVQATQKVLQAIKHLDEGTAQMVHSVKETTKMVAQSSDESQSIAAASEEQSASMEEVAASSVALSNMAEELSGIVGSFKLNSL